MYRGRVPYAGMRMRWGRHSARTGWRNRKRSDGSHERFEILRLEQFRCGLGCGAGMIGLRGRVRWVLGVLNHRRRGRYEWRRRKFLARNDDHEDPHPFGPLSGDLETVEEFKEVGIRVGRTERNGVHVFGGPRGWCGAIRQANGISAVKSA